MAEKKISELETATNLQDGCCFPLVSDGVTKKVTFATLLAKILTNVPIDNINANTAARHTHGNKTALDSITATKINGWNTAASTAESAYNLADVAVAAAEDAQATADSAVDTATSKAPTDHAHTTTTYGAGTASKYGHVKLSDSTSNISGASSGVAATPSAVKAAYDLASKAVTTLLGGKKLVCGWSDVSFISTKDMETTISYGTTFTAKPVVLISQPFNGVVCTALEANVTTTNFKVYVPKVGSTTQSTRKMAWLAIGSI